VPTVEKVRGVRVAAALALAGMLVSASGCRGAKGDPSPWRTLEPGLEMAVWSSRSGQPDAAGDLRILRVDPQRWRLRVISTETAGSREGLSLEQWCGEFGLVAAINAGMYQEDGLTHVGYCQVDGCVLNPAVNHYRSALALDPLRPQDPPLRIFDLDETALDSVAATYRTVVQNLRLIKRSGEARWRAGTETWTEAALGEDAQGRALLMHCSRPLSMHDFNTLILGLPLDVVCAQHLEGNLPAQLWVDHSRLGPGGPTWDPARILPVVLGVSPRDSLSR